MKLLQLTNEQLERVYNELVHNVEYNEKFHVSIDVTDTLTVFADGRIDVDGYREDDYLNGTGAFVETGRAVCLHLTAKRYTPDGDEVETLKVCSDTRRRIEEICKNI